jgi:predicted GIY-YIG superfamily endonuclease
MGEEKHYLYVLKYKPLDDSPLVTTHREHGWYVGMTNDYERRIRQHKSGHGARCLKDKTIVNDFLVGWDEEKGYIEELEKNLTKALAKEFGWDCAKEGDFSKRKRGALPDVSDCELSPSVGKALKNIGDPELEMVAEHSRTTLEVTDELEFGTIEEAREWADRFLPDGTEYNLHVPIYPSETHTSDRGRLGDQH